MKTMSALLPLVVTTSRLSASVCTAFAPSAKTAVVAAAAAATTTTTSPRTTALGMFTGIVEEMGTVVSMEDRNDMTLWDGSSGRGTELVVKGGVVMEGAYLGCSICVSGVCLTATVLDPSLQTFTVGLAPETLDKTYFRSLRPGQAVNLERASEIGGRNSGHFVQGHVDGTGTIVDKRIDGDSLRITVRVDPDHVDGILRYVVPKGFIAIDGTSLTVVDVDAEQQTFSFMLVEYTQKKIVIPAKLVGDKVNLEVDVLGKYSETAMSSLLPRLEALEAKVESLERSLAAAAAAAGVSATSPPPQQGLNPPPQQGLNPPQQGLNPPQQGVNPPPQQQRQSYGGYASNQKKMSIGEATPTFGTNLGGQGVANDYANPAMMQPESGETTTPDVAGGGSGSAEGGGEQQQQQQQQPAVRRVAVAPDPKMDDVGGISGDKFFRIDGS